MLNYRSLIAISLLLLCLAPSQSLAEEVGKLFDLPLEELMNIKVRTASKGDEAIGDAPAVISTISRDEISRFGANNLAEVLDRSTSLLITGSHMYPQNATSIRGDLATHIDNHVLVLINGRPVREGLFGGLNSPLYTSFPLATIEKIEVIRGPGSVLYGSNAYSGVINIMTQKAQKEGWSGRVAAKGGSFNTQGVEANGVWKEGDLDVNGGLQFFREDGWNFNATDERGVKDSALWGENNLALFFNSTYKELSLDFYWSSNKQAHMGSLPIWSGEQSLDTDKIFVNMGWDHRFTDWWRLSVNGTYNMFSNLLKLPVAVNGQPSQLYPNTQDSRDGLLELTNFIESGKWKWMLGSSVNVMSGVEFSHDSSQVVSTEIGNFIEPWYSVYTQIDYQLLDSLKLIVGAQGIKTSQKEWGAVPRVGAIYHFNEETGIKVLYGEAFRSPFRLEESINVPGVLIGNPAIRPETVGTVDIQAFYNNNAYQFAATYFNSIQNDLIKRIPVSGSSANTFTNKGELSLEGVELEGKLTLDDFFITSSATYQTNRNDAGVDNYTTIPNVMAKLGVNYKFTRQLTAGLFNSFISNYHDVQNHFPGASVATRIVNPEPKPYNLMTLKLDYDFSTHLQHNKPVKVNLYAYNLLNEDIYQPEFNRGRINSIPVKQGRGFYVGIEYNY
jgi:outer membrane receptor for ferrienterochelin and colicin